MIGGASKTKATAGNHSSVLEQMSETLEYAKKIGLDENDIVRIIRDVNKNVKADKQNSSIDFEAVINGYAVEKSLNIPTEDKKSLSRKLADVALYAKPKAADLQKKMLDSAPGKIRDSHAPGGKQVYIDATWRNKTIENKIIGTDDLTLSMPCSLSKKQGANSKRVNSKE